MTRQTLVVLAAAALVGCGEKAQEAQNAANAVAAVAGAASTMEDNQKEAEKFQADRVSKGDTVAMGYAELQKFLPPAPEGYTAAGDPEGSSQSMPGYSMSTAEQMFNGPAAADGNTPSVHVSIIDFGGTQAAYGMMALPMMMNLSQEDAHQRYRTLKMDTQYTWGSEEYNKDNKNTKVTAVTRYRYMIAVEARNQAGDESDMVKKMAEEIAKKFEGK